MKGPDQLKGWLALALTALDGSPVYLMPFAVMGVRAEGTGSVVMVVGSTVAIVVKEAPIQVWQAINELMKEEDDDDESEGG